jgi:hypothetical protein
LYNIFQDLARNCIKKLENNLNQRNGEILMKSYCSNCNKETNHNVISEYPVSYDDEETGIRGTDTYQIVKCNGCDSISFRQESFCSEDVDPYTGQAIPTINLYLKVSKNDLHTKQISGIPTKIRRIYRETIDNYNNENFTLCAVGLRAIIEGICAEKGISDGPVTDAKTGNTSRKNTLQGKIGGLFEKSLLTKQHANILHEHRFLGNEAAHELDMPSREELKLAIDIIEHTLQNIYELQYKAQDLQWQRTQRKKKN